jgi:O-antigen/teichoic acid export membrane protein
MITNVISPTTTAYYFMAIQIANLLFVIPSATTNSLFAEGSHNEKGLNKQIRKSIRIISILLIPSIIVIILFGNYILLAFGSEYSNQGFNFLRIMALSGIFVGINSIFGGVLKVKKNVGRILWVNIIGMIIIIGGSFVLIRNDYGLMGVGIAYISGQIAMGLSYWLMSFKK